MSNKPVIILTTVSLFVRNESALATASSFDCVAADARCLSRANRGTDGSLGALERMLRITVRHVCKDGPVVRWTYRWLPIGLAAGRSDDRLTPFADQMVAPGAILQTE
jgi:hypothetical protein